MGGGGVIVVVFWLLHLNVAIMPSPTLPLHTAGSLSRWTVWSLNWLVPCILCCGIVVCLCCRTKDGKLFPVKRAVKTATAKEMAAILVTVLVALTLSMGSGGLKHTRGLKRLLLPYRSRYLRRRFHWQQIALECLQIDMLQQIGFLWEY